MIFDSSLGHTMIFWNHENDFVNTLEHMGGKTFEHLQYFLFSLYSTHIEMPGLLCIAEGFSIFDPDWEIWIRIFEKLLCSGLRPKFLWWIQ